MPIFGVKSSFLKLGILAVQKRELIIEEVHPKTGEAPPGGPAHPIFFTSLLLSEMM